MHPLSTSAVKENPCHFFKTLAVCEVWGDLIAMPDA